MAGPRIGRAATVSARLLRLETRLARAERQLRAALALRGRLRVLERRLEKGGAEAARRSAGPGAAGGGREAARPRARRVPVRLQDVWVHCGEREWRALGGWRRAPRRAVLRSDSRTLPALEPDSPGRDAQPGVQHRSRPSARGGERGDPAGTRTEESIIHIKQEEELCATDQQQGEAGEVPEEPCQEQGLQEPEASSQARKGKELYPRELPSTEGEGFPREPDSGFHTYTTDVLSWIKQEEEPCCPEPQGSGKEEISTDSSTAHNESTKRDPPADCFESIMCGSEVSGRPGEKFSKDPSPGVTWDSQWNSEMMETSSAGQGLGGDGQYERGFGQQLDFFSTQENSAGKRLCVYSKCERGSSQLENLPAAREGEPFPGLTCEKSLGERVFHLLPSQPSEKGLGAAPASCQGSQLEGGQTPTCGTLLGDPNSLMGEEQPPGESEENPTEAPTTTSPCWDHLQDKAEACTCCPQDRAMACTHYPQDKAEACIHYPQDRAEACTRCPQDRAEACTHYPQDKAMACTHYPQDRAEACTRCAQDKAEACTRCPQDRAEACTRCPQPLAPRGVPPNPPQSQGRGKSYICSDCGKSFVCHSWLVRHQMTHTGERPYKCSECDKSYRRKDYLLNHQRRHSGQGVFQCPLCRKRFVLRRSFLKHQESHVQETHLTLAGWPCAEIRGAVMHSI